MESPTAVTQGLGEYLQSTYLYPSDGYDDRPAINRRNMNGLLATARLYTRSIVIKLGVYSLGAL
jgi:hypothetical protein